MAVRVKATHVNGAVGETDQYRLTMMDTVTINTRRYLQLMSAKTGMPEEQCRYWQDCHRSVMYSCLAANQAVDLGYVFAKLYATGTIASATDQPTKRDNPVKARIYFKGEFAKKVAQMELVNETESVNSILYELQQDGVSDLNRIESTTARIVTNGDKIKIDANQSDNGVQLEDLRTNIKVAQGVVSYSDSSVCYCTFPTLPVTGRYRFVLLTRNGEDPDKYVLSRVTRNVYVLNEEVNNG